MTAIADVAVPALAVDAESNVFRGAAVELPPRGTISEEKRATRRLLLSAARSAVTWPGRAWGALDLLVAVASFVLAHLTSPRFSFDAAPIYLVSVGAVVFATALLFFNYGLGAYDRHNFMSIGQMAGRTCAANALALGLTSLLFGWFGYVHIGRLIILGTFLLSAGGTFACRMTARELARHAKIRVILVGSPRRFRPLATRIRRLHSAFYERPIYFARHRDGPGSRASVFSMLRRYEPHEIIVMDDDPALFEVLRDSAEILRSGCAIFSHFTYYERLFGQVPIDSIDERGVLGGGFNIGSLHTGLAKRPIDVALASAGLLLAAPLMLLCCLLVKATSRGPIIYSQERLGRYGRPFRIYKFRTMRTDAEMSGAVWALPRDNRLTAIGSVLRKTRLDELPQLWNILCGEMSLVGPRPERPEFVAMLRRQIPHYDLRHLVLPGLTGWAQVRFRYGATVADARRKLAFDLYYVRNCGLIFDAAICLRTILVMAKGAR